MTGKARAARLPEALPWTGRAAGWLRGSRGGLLVIALVVGAGSGLGAVAFRYLIYFFTAFHRLDADVPRLLPDRREHIRTLELCHPPVFVLALPRLRFASLGLMEVACVIVVGVSSTPGD